MALQHPPNKSPSLPLNGKMDHADLRQLMIHLTSQLNPHTDTPSLDAQVLLAHVIDVSRAWVLAHPEYKLKPPQMDALIQGLQRIQAGEPLPFVLGHWEFYGLDLKITPDVLIPRPETELLVDKALDWLHKHPTKRTVVDVGTGSGCIAVALAVNIPDLLVYATDISIEALMVAQANAYKHGVKERIKFICADLLAPFADRSLSSNKKLKPDLICANPPYIPTQRLQSSDVFGREPTVALDGGYEGLRAIKVILNTAPIYLSRDGCVILEIDAFHGERVYQLARKAFRKARISLLTDLAGRNRLITIQTD